MKKPRQSLRFLGSEMDLFRWVAQNENVLIRNDALDAVQIDAKAAQSEVLHWRHFSTVKGLRTYLNRI